MLHISIYFFKQNKWKYVYSLSMSAEEKNVQNKININPSYLQRFHH
jgi:hypothetical protein